MLSAASYSSVLEVPISLSYHPFQHWTANVTGHWHSKASRLKQTGFLKANYWFWHIKWIFNLQKCYCPANTWGVGTTFMFKRKLGMATMSWFQICERIDPKAPWNIHFSSAIKFSGIILLRLAISSGMKMPKMWIPAWFATAKNPSLLHRIRSAFWAVKGS